VKLGTKAHILASTSFPSMRDAPYSADIKEPMRADRMPAFKLCKSKILSARPIDTERQCLIAKETDRKCGRLERELQISEVKRHPSLLAGHEDPELVIGGALWPRYPLSARMQATVLPTSESMSGITVARQCAFSFT
jgi:hypothetical protein